MRLIPWGKAKKPSFNELQNVVIDKIGDRNKHVRLEIVKQDKLTRELDKVKGQLTSYQNEFGINIMPQRIAGQAITIKTAMGLDIVYACIRDKAESIGQLPVMVKRNGKKLGRGIREFKIFSQKPNDYMTMQELVEMYVTCLEARGNFYMLANRNKLGSIYELLPFRFQENVHVDMDTNGNVYYTYVTNDGKPNVAFAGDEIIHLKLNSLNGLNGLSPISTAASAYGIAIAQETYLESLMENGAMPKGLLHTENVFAEESDVQRIRDQWTDNFSGAKNAGKTPLLEYGLKYQALGISPHDSELIKQRTFSRLQICSIFRVPPQRMGIIEAQKFKTLEETNKSYLRDSLMPLITKFENGINNRLPDSLQIQFNVTAYARGDRASMVQALKDEFSTGAISINEMREDLDRDPVEGGDVHAIDTNNFTFGQLPDIKKLQEENRALLAQAQETPEPSGSEDDAE